MLTPLAADRSSAPVPPADVSHQAYSLLQAHLRRYPYASVARHAAGPHAGRPYLLIDERGAWQPLEAVKWVLAWQRRPCDSAPARARTSGGLAWRLRRADGLHGSPPCRDRRGLTNTYIFEEAIKVGFGAGPGWRPSV